MVFEMLIILPFGRKDIFIDVIKASITLGPIIIITTDTTIVTVTFALNGPINFIICYTCLVIFTIVASRHSFKKKRAENKSLPVYML